jgi:hypothetical protein
MSDLISPTGELMDYKVSDNVPDYYPFRSQTLQVQWNAYVVRHAQEWKPPGRGQEWQPIDTFPMDIPEIRSAALVYLGPKQPKTLISEKKQPVLITRGPKAGEYMDKRAPYIFTDEEVLGGSKKDEKGMVEMVRLFKMGMDAFPDFPDELHEAIGGPKGWTCPGAPLCYLPSCTARNYPDNLVWERPNAEA